MKLSARARYGTRALLELALHWGASIILRLALILTFV